jgi:hypothetical protein
MAQYLFNLSADLGLNIGPFGITLPSAVARPLSRFCAFIARILD